MSGKEVNNKSKSTPTTPSKESSKKPTDRSLEAEDQMQQVLDKNTTKLSNRSEQTLDQQPLKNDTVKKEHDVATIYDDLKRKQQALKQKLEDTLKRASSSSSSTEPT